MIDKFCEYLTNKIRKNMPEVDDERAEVIKYGLQLLVGEVPKIFIMMGIAWALGILKLTLICFCMMLPYRMYSGGFHLKTHLGCIIGTSIMYTGNAFVSQLFVIPVMWKIVVSVILWVFAIIMIYLYAPADTEDVPVIAKRERKKRKVISYVVVSVMLVCGCVVQNAVISNMLIVGVLLQSCSISRLAYRVTGNRFGYEVYYEEC
nr:accessory gene regulator B family protein [Clostridia bacterium]